MTTFIAYAAALITMLLGLIGTIFETRRAGRLTMMGRVAVGLIVASGLISLTTRYLADEADRARVAQAGVERQAAIARSEESLRALGAAQDQIKGLEAALAASERRERLALLRSADVRLQATVAFERQGAFSEGPWADRYAFLVDTGTEDDPRISAEAVALCEQDTQDLCVIDYLAEPSQAERAAGNARGGAIRLSAAYGSRLWSALREGPLETRLYPPRVELWLAKSTLQCWIGRNQIFQFVFEPLDGQSRHGEVATDTSENPVPVCFPPTPAGRDWSAELWARPDTAGFMVNENPRLILELAGADPGRGRIEVSFSYDIRIDPLTRLEDLAGQMLRFGVYGPPGHEEVPYECIGLNDLTPGLSVAIRGDRREVTFRGLELEYFDNPWQQDWFSLRSEPGSVDYDPATMWQISGFGEQCGAEIILRFPLNETEITARLDDAR